MGFTVLNGTRAESPVMKDPPFCGNENTNDPFFAGLPPSFLVLIVINVKFPCWRWFVSDKMFFIFFFPLLFRFSKDQVFV